VAIGIQAWRGTACPGRKLGSITTHAKVTPYPPLKQNPGTVTVQTGLTASTRLHHIF